MYIKTMLYYVCRNSHDVWPYGHVGIAHLDRTTGLMIWGNGWGVREVRKGQFKGQMVACGQA